MLCASFIHVANGYGSDNRGHRNPILGHDRNREVSERRSSLQRRRTDALAAFRVISLSLATTLVAGCSTFLAVPEQQERGAANAVISGTVATEYGADGPLVVAITTRNGSDFVLYDHFVMEKPGPWVFALEPGTYWLSAFHDVDGDGRYDDEPAFRGDPDKPTHLDAGQRLTGVELRIPKEGRFLRKNFSLSELESRDLGEQQRISLFSLSVAGKVTTLADPRFARDVATKGLWKYYDFLLDTQPGIYFLQEYDPDKIPVLFVHGIGGTPQEFGPLIDALDRERFQPWVFYYPSGGHLDGVATLLTQLFVRLRIEHRFEKAAVVAHSMGGLVTRQFLLEDFETNGTKTVRTYVTISSPLGGMKSAGLAVEQSPIVVHSWAGLAPGSEFLDGLFYLDPATKQERRRLPDHMAYHMLFGYSSGGSSESSDGVVPLASQLAMEAQEEAQTERGYDEDHTSILRNLDAAARINQLLGDLR